MRNLAVFAALSLCFGALVILQSDPPRTRLALLRSWLAAAAGFAIPVIIFVRIPALVRSVRGVPDPPAMEFESSGAPLGGATFRSAPPSAKHPIR